MSQNFTFDHKGETVEFEGNLAEVRSPRWLRANRRRDELDLIFTILEEFGGRAVLAAVDDMSEADFSAFQLTLNKAIWDSTPGE